MTMSTSAEVTALVKGLAAKRSRQVRRTPLVLSLPLLPAAEALRSAMDRVTANLEAAVRGVPVRDLAETLAEVASARQRHDDAVFETVAKYCPWCETRKPRDQFNKNRRNGDGLAGFCAACDQERAKSARAAGSIRKADPRKIKARSMVRSAIVAGRLVRPSACQSCASTGPIHAHHHDYAKPLEVAWLCVDCHAEAHSV